MLTWKYGFNFKLSTNKAFEVEYLKGVYNWFVLHFEWTSKTDHAGLHINLGLFNRELSVKLYDKRHWNYKEKRWSNSQED